MVVRLSSVAGQLCVGRADLKNVALGCNTARTASVASGASAPLFHALSGGAFISDDWGFLSYAGESTRWFEHGDYLNRPGQTAIHALQFTLLGQSRVAHALVLAAAGAVVALLLFEVVRREYGLVVGALTGVVWGSLPMVSTIRFWNSTTPTLVAMALLLWGLLPLAGNQHPDSRDMRRLSVACAGSALIYEAGVPIGIMVLFLVWWFRTDRRKRTLLLATGLPAAVLAYNAVTTPKTIDSRILFEFAAEAPKALFGHGLLPDGAGQVGGLLIALPLLVLLTWPMKSCRRSWHDAAVLGCLTAAAGISIFAAVGFPIVTRGIMDRSAAFASMGVALFLGALISPLIERRRVIGAGLALVVVGGLASTNIVTSLQVRRAEADLLEAHARLADLPSTGERIEVVVPGRSGWVGGLGGIHTAVAETTGRAIPENAEVRVASLDDPPGQVTIAFVGPWSRHPATRR